jgi:branched-chain amino acid transport system permease protein
VTRTVLAGLALGLALLSVYPAVASGYGIRFMLQLFMWVTLAQSWNLISGLTGYVSFGHVAFFGTGAYTTSILVAAHGWHWAPASLAGGGRGHRRRLRHHYVALRVAADDDPRR